MAATWKRVKVRALRRSAERSNNERQASRPLRIAYSFQSSHCCSIKWPDPLESVALCYGEQSLGLSAHAPALPLPSIVTNPSQAAPHTF